MRGVKKALNLASLFSAARQDIFAYDVALVASLAAMAAVRLSANLGGKAGGKAEAKTWVKPFAD